MITNKEAFKKGRKAYNDGYPKSDNPFPKYDKNKLNTPNRDHISWNEGYDYVKKAGLEENKMSKFEQYLLEAQKYKSAGTSINVSKLPATFSKLEKMGIVKPGMIVADLGGGKYDNAIEWAKNKEASLHVIDPYNRTLEYNKKSLEEVRGRADIATINNVLNVINEPEQRRKVLLRAHRVLKEGGRLFVLIYEGDKSGVGRETQKGESWQNNRSTKEYLDEVKTIFGEATIKNGMIMATK